MFSTNIVNFDGFMKFSTSVNSSLLIILRCSYQFLYL